MDFESVRPTRPAPPAVSECRLDMVDESQITIEEDTSTFNYLGARIDIGAIPEWLERGWIEIETVWESFGERQPWQDDDEVTVASRSRARMRIYRHAVVTASVVYADEPVP